MTAIQLLETLGANPSFELDPASKKELLDQLEDAPKINFVGIFPAEDEDEKEKEKEKENDEDEGQKKDDQPQREAPLKK